MKFIIGIILLYIINSCQLYKTGMENELMYTDFRSSQKSYQSSDGRINYIDEGEGPVILLLHGVPSSSWLYRKMIPELVASGYRVIAPDMLGFGASDNPKGYEIYSPSNHAKRLLGLMKSLKLESWSHVMHDAGGLWTWELLKLEPQCIDHLIVLNTIIYEEGFNPPVRMKPGGFAKFSMWLYRNGVTTNLMLNQLFKSALNKNDLTKEEFQGYKTPLREGKTRGMYQFFTTTCSSFQGYDGELNLQETPVSVIWGENDNMLKWEPQKDKVIQGLHVLPENVHLIDAKHFIQEEEPKMISSLINDFLQSK